MLIDTPFYPQMSITLAAASVQHARQAELDGLNLNPFRKGSMTHRTCIVPKWNKQFYIRYKMQNHYQMLLNAIQKGLDHRTHSKGEWHSEKLIILFIPD